MKSGLSLSDNEERVVRRALNGLWHDSQYKSGRNDRVGWKPAPGKIDIHKATIETIEKLFERINELNPRDGQ